MADKRELAATRANAHLARAVEWLDKASCEAEIAGDEYATRFIDAIEAAVDACEVQVGDRETRDTSEGER